MLRLPLEITEISSEGFEVQILGMDFIFVKNENDLIVFEGEEREIDGEVMMLIPNDDTTHINYNGTKIYFEKYVIADEEYAPIIKCIIGYLSFYYRP